MNRIKSHILLLSLILILFLPTSVFATTSLKFNEVESQMLEKNSVIQNNYDTLNDAVDAKDGGITAMDALLTQWSAVNTAYGSGDAGSPKDNAAITYLLNAQKTSLDQQKSTFANMDNNKTALNIQKANYTLIWNMEMLFISYNAISSQLDDLQIKKSLADRQLQIVKLQQDLGMVTGQTVIDAENSVLELESNIQKLTESKKAITQQFNVNLNQDYNTELVLSDVPDVTDEQLTAINVDSDYLFAKDKSYDIQIDSSSDSSKRIFRNNFYRTYQTILDKKKALDVEQKKMTAVENKLKIAQLKYDLGSISLLQLELEKNSYLSQKSITKIAKDTLAQAYRQYEWAKRGLIVSSGS